MRKKDFTVTIFGSSSPVRDKLLLGRCLWFGSECARRGWILKTGGGKYPSVMGAVADGALTNGGKVHGVIFKGFLYRAHNNIKNMKITRDLLQRKRHLLNTDAVLVFPGGIGTLNEIFEVLASKQAGLSFLPVVIFNHCGYYDGLFRWLKACMKSNASMPFPGKVFVYRSLSSCVNRLSLIARSR